MADRSTPTARDCIARIIDAAGGAVTVDEIAELEAKIERRSRMRARETPTESTDARILAVAKEMAEEERIKAFLEKRSAAINVLRRKKIASFIEAAPVNKVEALNALNVGGIKGFDGSFLSVQAKSLALEMDLWGGMMADLRRANLLDPLKARTPEFDREISDALEDVDADPATATKAHSPLAQKVAAIFAKHQENARLLLNDAGAFVRKMPGWIVRQSHDPVKLQAAGFERWYSSILPKLDERTFQDIDVKYTVDAAEPSFDAAYRAAEDKARKAFLLKAYNGLVTGVHETGSADWLHAFKMPGNKAKSVSQERVLHFKKYQWFDYNAEFGRGTLLEEMAHGVELSARNIALMRTWGTNPEGMFNAVRRDLAEKVANDVTLSPKVKDEQIKAINGFWAQSFFDQINGTANTGGSPTWSRRMANVRSWIAMSKLGGVVLSAFPDIGVKASLARHNGVGYFEGLGNGVTSLVRDKSNAEREAILDHVRGFSEAVTGSIFNRFSADSGLSGGMNRAMRWYFKLNLMSFWDNAQRDGFADFLARNTANQLKGDFASLDRRFQATLRGYGIGEKEWALLRPATRDDPTSSAGGKLLTPDMVDDLPNEHFHPYRADEVAKFEADQRATLTSKIEADKVTEAREGSWVSKRIARFKEKHATALERLNAIKRSKGDRTAETVAGYQSRIDLMAAQIDQAKNEADILGAMRGLKNQQDLDAFVENTNAGGREAKRSSGISERAGALSKSADDLQAKTDADWAAHKDGASEAERDFQSYWEDKNRELQRWLDRAKSKTGPETSNRIKDRVARFEEQFQKATERFERVSGNKADRASGRAAAGENRLDLMAARIEELRGMAADSAEASASKLGQKIAGRADRLIGKTARESLSIGERLGQRRGELKQRISALKREIREAEEGQSKEFEARDREFIDYHGEKQKELAAWMDEIRDRQRVRQEAIKAASDDLPAKVARRREIEAKASRQDVKERLSAYYADQLRQASTRPGARERALVTLGTVAGTPAGEAARFLMQFKAFGIGFVTQHMMREFVRGARPDYAGIAMLIAGTSSLGYLSMTAKELIAGKNPRDITQPSNWPKVIGAAMAQGGGLGIYGDFLFGEYNRFGQSGIATLGGPAVGISEDIARLYSDTSDWAKGDRKASPLAETVNLVKSNAPFANLFWARLALDQMIFNQLQEAMNPGYLRRTEQRVKDQNAQTYWLPPSAGHDALRGMQ